MFCERIKWDNVWETREGFWERGYLKCSLLPLPSPSKLLSSPESSSCCILLAGGCKGNPEFCCGPWDHTTRGFPSCGLGKHLVNGTELKCLGHQPVSIGKICAWIARGRSGDYWEVQWNLHQTRRERWNKLQIMENSNMFKEWGKAMKCEIK